MKTNFLTKANPYLLWIIIGLLSLIYFSSIMQVPFHPDESTQIFMSSDVDIFFTTPNALIWNKNSPDDRRMELRMLDAPLTRYIIGIARYITGQEAVPVDWDWSLSFSENSRNGALPGNDLLLTARMSVSFLFPISLFLIWQLLKNNFSNLAGWVGILATAGNALILLHTRRSMAESLTFFLVICLVYILFLKRPSPVLLGIVTGLAFNAKQSTIIWLILMFAFIISGSNFFKVSFVRKLRNLSLCAISFFIITLLLNPYMWKHPFLASNEAFARRSILVEKQLEDLIRVSPDSALDTPMERISSIVGNLYFTPPAVTDTANYLKDLSAEINQYTGNPGNSLFRNMLGSALLLTFTLLGIYTIFRFPSPYHHREEILLLIAGILQFLFLILNVPLPYQRYVMPLMPMAIVFFAIGISKFLELTYKVLFPRIQERSNPD